MANHLERQPIYQRMPESMLSPLDPLNALDFVPHEVKRRMIAADWKEHANSIMRNLGFLPTRENGMISDQKLEFLETPNSHENSDAQYIYEAEHGRDWVGIYYLGPNSVTSQHDHPAGVMEEYYSLFGEMTIQIDGKDEVLKTDKKVIHSGQTHHGRTEENQHALVMVVMRGAALLPPEKRHNNSRKPQNTP